MASEQLLVRLNMDARQYNTQARTAAANTAAVGASAKTTARATGGLGAKMKGLATGGGGLVAVAGGAFAVKQAFDGTVGAFASFDDAMTESLAIMGDVSDEMRTEMSDAAREVAKATTFSAEEAAEAYFFLASAGLDAAASVEAMPAVAEFAQAGMFDMATATDLATDAQSALGLASDDASKNLENLTRVTDVFVKANTLANTSVQQISEAMTTRAGAALRALNKDVEEGAAVLAALADQGVKGAQAGTQLGIVLRDLQTRALENKDAFQEAGIAVFNAEGNMRNIADIIGDLEGRFDGMSDAQKRAELASLGFADRSIAVLTTLLGTSDAIREYESELRSAGGTTEEVAEKQLQSATKQWELFKSELADVGLEIGEELVPALMELLPAVRGAADVIGSIDFAAVAQNAAPLVDALSLLNNLMGETGDEAEGASIGTQILGGAFDGLMTAMNPLKKPYDAIKEAMQDGDDASREAAEGFSILGGEMGQIPGAAEDAGDGFDDFVDDADDVADSAEDAAVSVRDLTLAFLEAADPIFAAQGALDRYERAEANLEETRADSASTARDIAAAELDVANAALQAEAALVALGDGSITEGISAIAAALNISDEEARNLLETLGILDGTEVTSVVNTEFRTIGSPPSSSIGAQDNISFRHSGGPGRAGEPYRIRPDEEIFVPSGNGEFLLNNEVLDALKGLSSNSNTTTTNNYNIPVQSTGDHNTDAQLVSSITSVLRRMETM